MSQKREQLIETAIRLFAEEGVGVATARIAKEANVSNGTLFNHFETKQVLIDSVYAHIKKVMGDEILSALDMELPSHDLFLDVWLSFSAWCRKHPLEKTALDLLKSSQLLTKKVKDEEHDAWSDIANKVTEGIDQKILTQVPVEIISLTSESMLNAVMGYAAAKKLSSKELETTVKQSFEIFWRGITTERSTKRR